MGHGAVRALLVTEVAQKIMERYNVDENTALDRFYRSATAASLADDETGLYGQSPYFIFGLYEQEMSEENRG